MRALSKFVLRWAGLISFVGTALGILGGYYSVQLYKNLRTDIEELLPTTARSVIDLAEVTKRLESIDNIAVLIFTQDSKAGKKFVDDLAIKLSLVPKSVLSSYEYRITTELKFFKDRQPLYMELEDLTRVRDYISNRISFEKELYNPLNIFNGKDIPEPKLDFYALKGKYEGRTSSFERFPDGYYATPDGKLRVVLAYMPGKSSGIGQVHALKNAVKSAIDELKPTSYASDLVIKYTGGVQDTLEEHEALIADLELSTIIVVILVTAAMLIFFRVLRATIALILSLFMGTLWTFGVSYFVVGYLNANSAFLGSIVIGNGINFGIILLARYIEERRRGFSNERATVKAIETTATSTWTAALAAGLSYGSLVLTGFRGFRQFGTIGLIGMVLCWISAYVLMPAYLTVFERFRSLMSRGRATPKSFLASAVATGVEKFPLAIWSASFLITIASLGMFVRYTPKIIETNMGNLRNKESIQHGSAFLSKHLDQVFQHYLTPVALLPHSRENAREIAERLRELKAKQGKRSLLATIQTLDDFIPDRQYEKIQVVKQIRKLLPPHLVQRLTASDQQLVARLLSDAALKPVYQKDLPELILRKFTEKDGSIGKLVLVEPPLNNEMWEGDYLMRFIQELRATADSVEPGTAVAGTLPITSDMIRAISTDGPKATLFAFAAVVLLVIFLFRNVATISLILFALMLGVVWLAGIILGFGIKINFLNFIALPITFGIGVDYGVNVFQRYRLEGGSNIIKVIRNTGGGVGLGSFTTIVGYCSLLLAGP
ncbi:MAG: MMPL family transporter, partial [Bdellovibrionota bacterium]